MNSSFTSDPWIGRLIGEHQRYRLEKRIGAGGMGDVFLATDTRLGQQVALKVLKDTLATAEDLRKRFKREIDICAALASTHIIQVWDCGVTAEGYPFYVMEYLRGQSLGQLLRREKQLPVERTVRIIRQVCAGLYMAHEGVPVQRDGAASEHIQVIHRDLKPDNIFLIPTDLGELVKILDFGIAKLRNDVVEYTNLTSTFQGTFRYAAPEQLQVEQNIDGRADIYSLGIILYEMLSGADPFGFGVKGRSTSGVTWGIAHISKQAQALRSQPGCEQLPAELEAIVMRCLQKTPEDRFTSVEELSRSLQAVISILSNGTSNSLSSVEQLVDETIFQTPPPEQPSLDQTITRPLTPPKQVTPDATLAQISSIPTQNERPLEETNAQILTPSKRVNPETTFTRIPATPSEQKGLDNTTAQIQSPQNLRDVTNVQVPLPSEQKTPDAKIAQSFSSSLNEPETPNATIAQVPTAQGRISPDNTIAQVNSSLSIVRNNAVNPQYTTPHQEQARRLPIHLLLSVGIITLLAASGVMFAYSKFQSQPNIMVNPLQQSNTPTPTPTHTPDSTPTTFEPCRENPDSVFCVK